MGDQSCCGSEMSLKLHGGVCEMKEKKKKLMGDGWVIMVWFRNVVKLHVGV